ncbi:hypothetical protein RhiirA5_413353 [Rhizophagus irregularis]|uniref:Uncharacterized protein n=1 Tax=Rhizophagus irregularis TaxID=588596 RepID=A0A2N0PWS1_9GLOM|nr:hypothetical protein RhiirA5_413353 [Rhizophagus irregularis]
MTYIDLHNINNIVKKQSRFSRYLTIVKKYNILQNNSDNLSETNNKNFKNILVYLIHCKLPNRFKRGGCQLVSLACIEHQFFDIFKRYIHHHSNKNIYKCIFQGTIGYQTLSEILNNPLWDQRSYDQTYIVLFNNPLQHLKNNPLDIVANCAEGITTKRCKSKYNPGEITIE